MVGPIDVKQKKMSQLDATLTRVHLTLTFDLDFWGQIESREWDGDALMWNAKEMGRLDAVLTGVPLILTFDLESFRSNCISGMLGPIVMEQKRRGSIGCPDVKHNYYVDWRHRILSGTGVTKDVGDSVDSSSSNA